jgi:hypothetical protein
LRSLEALGQGDRIVWPLVETSSDPFDLAGFECPRDDLCGDAFVPRLKRPDDRPVGEDLAQAIALGGTAIM